MHGKTWIGARFRDDHRLAILSYPADYTLAHLDPQVAVAGRFAGGNRIIKVLVVFVDDEQRPGFWLEKLLHLLHDGAQDRIQVEGRSQRTCYVVKDPQVFRQWRTLWEGTIDHLRTEPRLWRL